MVPDVASVEFQIGQAGGFRSQMPLKKWGNLRFSKTGKKLRFALLFSRLKIQFKKRKDKNKTRQKKKQKKKTIALLIFVAQHKRLNHSNQGQVGQRCTLVQHSIASLAN